MIIDFRSDTVTKPTAPMLEAMMKAEVGDDVFAGDPTINALEAIAADMFEKEAALFCPSGTMTNQIAISVHTRPGDEVICDRLSHIYNYEGGGIAANSGCSVRLLAGDRGRFTAQDVANAVLPDDAHHPRTRLVSLENTCNKGGGSIWDDQEISAIKAVCEQHGLGLHLDGARLFNALVETGQSPAEAGRHFDSISICLSKGLGCPVGSLLLGSKSFIKESHRKRKLMGGGMRQAGYLAAAGIYALNHHVDRLKDDHALARELKDALEKRPWVESVVPISSNIVVAKLSDGVDTNETISKLESHGILTVPFGRGNIRFVTHLDITQEMVSFALEKIARL